MSEKLDLLFDKYLALNPDHNDLRRVFRLIKPLSDKVYPLMMEKLDEFIASEPEEHEKAIFIISLKSAFEYVETRRTELAERLLSLDPSDDTLILIMEKLPSYEEELLPKIKDKKKKYFYLMEKEADKLRRKQ